METLSLGLPFFAAFLNPGAWGRIHERDGDYPRMAGMWLVGEDMPQETNRVTLDPVAKDKFGLPVASVHYDDHPNDLAMRSPPTSRARRSTKPSARPRPTRRRPIRARIIWAPTG